MNPEQEESSGGLSYMAFTARERERRALEQLQQAQVNSGIDLSADVEGIWMSGFSSRSQRRKNKYDMNNTKKCRHLTQDERSYYHNPAPDWHESSRGEELRHSTTFIVLDILAKFKIQPV